MHFKTAFQTKKDLWSGFDFPHYVEISKLFLTLPLI